MSQEGGKKVSTKKTKALDPVQEFLGADEEDTEASTLTHISEQTTTTQETTTEVDYGQEQEEEIPPDESEFSICNKMGKTNNKSKIIIWCTVGIYFCILILAAPEERKERKEKEKAEAKCHILYKQWDKRGTISYGHKWQYLALSRVTSYVNMANKYTDTALTESQAVPSATIGRINHTSKDLPKVKRVHGCKYLHLQSQHNELANDIKRYVKVGMKSGLVQVSGYHKVNP